LASSDAIQALAVARAAKMQQRKSSNQQKRSIGGKAKTG
jgi:hypothetical protein